MKFVNANDIASEYGISVPTSRRHMAKMRDLFKIDESRLPRKGQLPKKIVDQYFRVDEDIKPIETEKGDTLCQH
jgi:hypothetical protein